MKTVLCALGIIGFINGMEDQVIDMDSKEGTLLFGKSRNCFNYTKTLKGHNDYGIGGVVFDPKNSNKLFSISRSALKIWDIKKSSCLKTLQNNDFPAESLAIGSDGTRIAIGGNNRILVYDVNQDKEEQLTLSNGYDFLNGCSVRRLSFIPDNDDIVVTCFEGNLKVGMSDVNVITIMDIQNKTKKIIEDYIGWLRDMIINPHDKKTLILASIDSAYHSGVLNFYDLETQQRKDTRRECVYKIVYHPQGEHTFVTCQWQSPYIALWDARGNKIVRYIKTDGYGIMENIGNDITFLPDGNTIAVSSENRTQLYDLSSGKCVQKLPNVYSFLHAINCCGRKDTGQHTRSISGTEVSPDGKTLVTYSGDNTIKVWEEKSYESYSN